MREDGPSIEFLPEYGREEPAADPDTALADEPPRRRLALGLGLLVVALLVLAVLVHHDPRQEPTAQPAPQPSIPVFTSTQRAPVDMGYPRYPVPGPAGSGGCTSCTSDRALPSTVVAAVRDAFPNARVGPALTVHRSNELVYRRFVATVGTVRIEVEARARATPGEPGTRCRTAGRSGSRSSSRTG